MITMMDTLEPMVTVKTVLAKYNTRPDGTQEDKPYEVVEGEEQMPLSQFLGMVGDKDGND